MSEKKIIIRGKEIDYGIMTDDQLVKLYQELQENKVKLYEQMVKMQEELNLLEEYN